MVRIILKNGDILKYPDATIAKGIYDTNLIELKDEDEKTRFAVFNINNIAGWDYKDDVVNGFKKIGTVYRKV